MEHGPPTEWKKDKCESYKTKLGLYLFAAYSLVYFAFIFIAVLNPKLMARDVGSLNLAITYGFALIVLAIVLALVYNFACSKREQRDAADDQVKEKKP